MATITDTTILDCGHVPSEHDTFTAGYGYDRENKTVCFDCCGKRDAETMRTENKIVLYLNKNDVSNWPGTLRIPIDYQRTGKHNMAGKRYDVWFTFEGMKWHGTQYGGMTQLCHCRKVK